MDSVSGYRAYRYNGVRSSNEISVVARDRRANVLGKMRSVALCVLMAARERHSATWARREKEKRAGGEHKTSLTMTNRYIGACPTGTPPDVNNSRTSRSRKSIAHGHLRTSASFLWPWPGWCIRFVHHFVGLKTPTTKIAGRIRRATSTKRGIIARCTSNMRRNWCRRMFDVLCPCFRRRSMMSSALGGTLDRHDVGLNFILHGECDVGKTSLRNRWVDGIFTGDVAPTFGVDFNIKTLDLMQKVEEDEEHAEDGGKGGKGQDKKSVNSPSEVGKNGHRTKQGSCADLQVKINVYDTSGKPGYREVNSTYLLAFDAVLFVYDISSRSSLDVRYWYGDHIISEPINGRMLPAQSRAA